MSDVKDILGLSRSNSNTSDSVIFKKPPLITSPLKSSEKTPKKIKNQMELIVRCTH